MLDAPAPLEAKQLDELCLDIDVAKVNKAKNA